MIKFEYNMLVLNNAFSEEDVQHISAYTQYVRKQERERIAEILKANDYDSEHLIALIMDK